MPSISLKKQGRELLRLLIWDWKPQPSLNRMAPLPSVGWNAWAGAACLNKMCRIQPRRNKERGVGTPAFYFTHQPSHHHSAQQPSGGEVAFFYTLSCLPKWTKQSLHLLVSEGLESKKSTVQTPLWEYWLQKEIGIKRKGLQRYM